MEEMYLYFDGFKNPVMTFNMSIINDIYEWCRSLAMCFTIDGYSFRPYNDDIRLIDTRPSYTIPHMDIWDKEVFREIINNFGPR